MNPSRDNTRRWIEALSKLPDGAARELAGQEDLFEREGEYAVRVNDAFTVDVMPSACGHRRDELKSHIEEKEVDGVRIRILGIEGLILTKQGMREKDRADRRVLEAALEKLRTR